eukprot:6201525-Pleurochrysis_carterae.AAC.1
MNSEAQRAHSKPGGRSTHCSCAVPAAIEGGGNSSRGMNRGLGPTLEIVQRATMHLFGATKSDLI